MTIVISLRKTTLFALGICAALALAWGWHTYANGLAQKPEQSKPASHAGRIILGRIMATEPLHIHLEGLGPDTGKTFDVLDGIFTRFLQLEPWAPGELDGAKRQYKAYIKKLNPKQGDSILPPPQSMKLVPWSSNTLEIGLAVGILTYPNQKADQPIVAEVVRPLIDQEIRNSSVGHDFPWP